MIVLDENIPESQRERLLGQRLSVAQIGLDIGRQGMQDDEVIRLLCELRRPTFFTLDSDFYRRVLCHDRYCLVYLEADEDDVADFVRRVLRLREFNTQAKRVGAVIRASVSAYSYWRKRAQSQFRRTWPDY